VSLQTWELLSYVVTVVGLPLAIVVFLLEQRKEEVLNLANSLHPRMVARGGGAVDLVALHPPYVAKRELRELPEEIRRFEPAHTLTDHSANGLGLVGRAAAESGTWLKRGGWLLIEVSPDRARSVAKVMRDHGFHDVRSTVDTGFKVTRVLVGRWR